MKMKSKITICFIWSIIPLFAAILYCLVSECFIWDIYLPDGWWNDEVVYYKQIGGIIKYGIPKGYFSYNEVSARIGTLGAWSPVAFVPYVIVGKIIGWNYFTPIITNLLYICGAFFIWIKCVRISWKQNACIALAYCAIPVITRYVLSGMSETIYFCGMIIWASLWLSEKRDKKVTISLYIISCLMTLIRPYYVLMFGIPLYYTAKKRKITNVISGCVFAAVSVIGYFLISKWFCAPYFEPLIKNLDLKNILPLILNGLHEIFESIKKCILEPHYAGEMYLIFLIMLVSICVIVVMSVIRKQWEKVIMFSYILFMNLALLGAIILLYDINVGSRHLCPFILLDILIIIGGYHSYISKMLCFLLLFAALVIPKETYIYRLPTKGNGEVQHETEIRTREFDKIFELYEGITWDNTIVWTLGVNYNVFYSVPDGVGISICYPYVLENKEIFSKYVVTASDYVFANDEYRAVFEDEKCKVFERN